MRWMSTGSMKEDWTATCGVLLRVFVDRVQSGIAIGVFACFCSAIILFVGKQRLNFGLNFSLSFSEWNLKRHIMKFVVWSKLALGKGKF